MWISSNSTSFSKEEKVGVWVRFWSGFSRTYELGDGVSSQRGVADPVLSHGALSVVPSRGQGRGRGFKDSQVPRSGSRD